MRLAALEVLSAAEIRQIHEASAHILNTAGIKVLGARMLEFLATKGCRVDRERGVAHLSGAMIDDALATVPRTFEVFDRTGRLAFVLGDRIPKIAAGHNAIHWLDSDTGQTRASRIGDVELFARICQDLEHIHMIGIPVMPQDVPNPQATLLHGIKACVENSTKPIYFSTDRASVNDAAIRLLAAAFEGDMKTQAYGISQLSPTSPLYWEDGVCDALERTVLQNIPLAILPEPNAGVSAPYTLAGLLVMNNAECLSGIVMSQLLRRGARILYANSWTCTDMRSGSALVGSTETSICRIAGAQMAMHYQVPCHTTAPNSDNHAHDEQNAWEKTFSTFCSVGARNDLIVNCGMFATGVTCSHEQLLMDEMISAASLRIAAGMRVTEDTVARDLIEKVGPMGMGAGGGNYLTQEHTLEHLRGDEYLTPRLTVVGPFTAWKERGAKDTYALAKDAVRKYRSAAPHPFDASRRSAMDEVIKSFRA
jgi:trimethylamine---corrinoid protein Co-methyltransferase